MSRYTAAKKDIIAQLNKISNLAVSKTASRIIPIKSNLPNSTYSPTSNDDPYGIRSPSNLRNERPSSIEDSSRQSPVSFQRNFSTSKLHQEITNVDNKPSPQPTYTHKRQQSENLYTKGSYFMHPLHLTPRPNMEVRGNLMKEIADLRQKLIEEKSKSARRSSITMELSTERRRHMSPRREEIASDEKKFHKILDKISIEKQEPKKIAEATSPTKILKFSLALNQDYSDKKESKNLTNLSLFP